MLGLMRMEWMGLITTALVPYMPLTMVSKPPRREKSVDSCS